MKKIKIKFIITLIFSICIFSELIAQQKFEKESRISKHKVPAKALLFIDSLNLKSKIKWYKEEGISKINYEAKFKYNKHLYSVEFDSSGMLEDIEKLITWNQIELKTQQEILNKLKTDCLKCKIEKVQIQYTSTNENDLLQLLKNNQKQSSIRINYEIVVKCTQSNNVDLIEYLFEESGHFLNSSIIIFKNSSHLEY